MIPEAPLDPTPEGLVPSGDGWFVLNAREAPWRHADGRTATCLFEGEPAFSQLGLNLTRLEPGQPMAIYHREADQEDFLVLEGEAVLVIEGEERPLRRWDLVHCPADTEHVIVGAGVGPCLVLSVGARIDSLRDDWGAYTVDETARAHGASVTVETTSAEEAYAGLPRRRPTRYREGWLPE